MIAVGLFSLTTSIIGRYHDTDTARMRGFIMDDYTKKKLNGYADNLGRMTTLDDETFLKQIKNEQAAESRFYAGFVADNQNGRKLRPLKDYNKVLDDAGRTEALKDPLDYSLGFLNNIVTSYVNDSNWDSIAQKIGKLLSEMNFNEKNSNMETEPTRKASARVLKLMVRLNVLALMAALREDTAIVMDLITDYAAEHHYLERIQRIIQDYNREMSNLTNSDSEAIKERMLDLVGEDQWMC